MTETRVQFAVRGVVDARCRRVELARLAGRYRQELPQLRLEARRAKHLFDRAARGDRYPRWDALLGARIDLAAAEGAVAELAIMVVELLEIESAEVALPDREC